MSEPGSCPKITLPGRVKALPPYVLGQLNALKYEKRVADIDVIDLGMGNPTDPTPPPIVEKLCEAVRQIGRTFPGKQRE